MQLTRRKHIDRIENFLKQVPESCTNGDGTIPVHHYFQDGIYTREIEIPAGTLLTSEIHRYAHPSFLMVGKCIVMTERNGTEVIEAPKLMITQAGTKRLIYVLETCVWCTVHRTDKTTIKAAEEDIIAPDYNDKILLQNKDRLLEAISWQ